MALLQNGDRVRIDLKRCTADILISEEALQQRRDVLAANGGYQTPDSQTPWQQYFRELAEPFNKGMTLRDADNYQDIARKGLPRDNH